MQRSKLVFASENKSEHNKNSYFYIISICTNDFKLVAIIDGFLCAPNFR